MTTPLLKVRDLTVAFKTKKGMADVVRGLSFDVYRGEALAIVGESGSGKTVSALAILGLLPKSAEVTGSVEFEGQNLLELPEKSIRQYRGNKISMIFQDPMTSFNPVHSIGKQIVEIILAHNSVTKTEARDQAIDLLEMVGVPEPARRVDQFPFEYSGGMRQRAMIAMAIANKPDLLLADEPTTALDVTIQAQVMDVLKDIRQEVQAALVLITHDLGVVASAADRVQVMYGGRIFERADVDTIFYETANPYTSGLLNSIVRVETADERLVPIVGSPPNLLAMPQGCAFAPRCVFAEERCTEREAQLEQVGLNHHSRCHRNGDPQLAKELQRIS